jgi:hypothetical protein
MAATFRALGHRQGGKPNWRQRPTAGGAAAATVKRAAELHKSSPAGAAPFIVTEGPPVPTRRPSDACGASTDPCSSGFRVCARPAGQTPGVRALGKLERFHEGGREVTFDQPALDAPTQEIRPKELKKRRAVLGAAARPD